MNSKLAVEFVSFKDATSSARAKKGSASPRTLVVFAGKDLSFGAQTTKLLGDSLESIRRAAASASFKGKASSVLELWGPDGLKFDRLLVVGAAAKEPPADKPLLVKAQAHGLLKRPVDHQTGDQRDGDAQQCA